MPNERRPANSRRTSSLTKKFASERYRHAYVSAHVRQFVARQVRALRGSMSQEDFADKLKMPQSSVSRLENPAKGMQLQTILDVASKLDRAVIVRIVDFATFLKFTGDQSEAAICPAAFHQEQMEELLRPPPSVPGTSGKAEVREVDEKRQQKSGPMDVQWHLWKDNAPQQPSSIH